MKRKESEFLEKIGKRIREIRMEKNISQTELAALCDFEKANMSRIEGGKANSTILRLHRISKELEVHISEILKD